MDVARPNIFGKGKNVLSSVTRNTSCSRGWLRLLLQTIFATITVCSFILIVIMAVKNPQPAPIFKPPVPPRCQIKSCRVICNKAPYFEDHEGDIIFAVAEANSECTRISLELNEPFFVNNTLPENWLSRIYNNIHNLAINDGNLMHIQSGAFMSHFLGNLEILLLQNLQIKTWDSTSLVGLSSLRSMIIHNCWIDSVYTNALRAVDDTLESLTITESGVWDPVHFTGFRGFEKLTLVDFSYNSFGEIINRNSFFGLQVTNILYLNSCRITAIGAGAFDHLTSIEVLYLNNNMLVTVPSGLFNAIVPLDNPRPRIHLQDNYWLCECSTDDLRQLIRKELLLVDATCTYPDEMNSKSFTQFECFCNNDNDSAVFDFSHGQHISQVKQYQFIPDTVYVNGSYCNSRIESVPTQVLSPLQNNTCSTKTFQHLNVTLDSQERQYVAFHSSKWIRFSNFFKTDSYSVVQIATMKNHTEYGLLWYQSTCPHELYCLDTIPNLLRVFNVDSYARYTFCPIHLTSASIVDENCVDFTFYEKKESNKEQDAFAVSLYLMTAIVCLCFGALIVYGLIRRRPTLLKGSKRILFVKHKNVEALVLPPKVPLRNDLSDAIDFKDTKIFTLSTGHKLKPPNLKRMKSVRSDKSGSPSYISAMQPTDDQLAEWRIHHHFNNDLTISSTKSELSTLSWVCADSYYYSLDDIDTTYESLK